MFSDSGLDEDHQKQIKRRRLRRLPPRLALACSIAEDGDFVGTIAEVIALCQSGVHLSTRPLYEPGSCLHIALSNADELFRYSTVLVVRVALVTAGGIHLMECEFLQELAYEYLRALLS
jgi:hypothetical protein